MDVNVDEQAIVDKLYESTKDWVSVEVELNKTMKPSVLFHLTEKDAGDRFYMRLNDNYSSYFGYHAIHRFKNDFENKQSIFKDWEKLKIILNLFIHIINIIILDCVAVFNFRVTNQMMNGENMV